MPILSFQVIQKSNENCLLKLQEKLSLRGVPTTVLFNTEGKEFARIMGSIDFDDLKFIEWLKNYN